MSFEYCIEMSKLKRRATNGEDIFGSVQDVYLNSFLKGIAMEAVDDCEHFVTYYHTVMGWMMQQTRDTKEFVCREYFINKAKVQYVSNFEMLIVGDKQYCIQN